MHILLYKTSYSQRLGIADEDDAFCVWVNKKVYYLSCYQWRMEERLRMFSNLSVLYSLRRHLCTFVAVGWVISSVLFIF